MAFFEIIKIFSNNDKLNIESKNLDSCYIVGSKERKDVKLQIDKLEVPENVDYEISNLIVENDVINQLSGHSIKFKNCTIQNIEGLLAINPREGRFLENVELSDENIVINTSYVFEKNQYKFDIDCTKAKEITQEMLDNFAKFHREGEQFILNFTIEQLKAIKENGLVIDKVCDVSTVIENASELSAQDAKEMMKTLNLKYVKITPKENESFCSHHIYEATEYQKSREVLDKILEGLDPNDSDKVKLLSEIYKRLAFHMKYDHDAVNDEKIEKERKFSSRNLVGGLLEGRCVCAGYAEILRNACAICGIESRYIFSKEKLTMEKEENILQYAHAFNQVKIDGVWYNVDLTWDRDRIVEGKLPQYFLKNDVDFKKIESKGSNGKYTVDRYHIPDDWNKFDKCDKNYSQGKIEKLFDSKKQPKYLVSILKLGKKIKNALERDDSLGTKNSNEVIKPEPKIENIEIFSNNDKLNIESKNLRRCIIVGSKEREDVKLQIDKLEVPENVDYEISNLIVENDVINQLSGSSIKLENCTIQNIEGLLEINQRKNRELKNVELSDENIVINTSDVSDDEYKFNIDCTKSKEISQEMLDNLAKLYRKGEQLTLSFTIKQLEEIQKKGLVIDKVCDVSTVIENASELSAQDTKKMMETLGLKYVKITPKENENAYSHHIYEAKVYQKSREELDKILKGLEPNDSNEAKIFAEIYKRLAFHIKFDYDVRKNEKKAEKRKFSSKDLVGGLLDRRCVHAGYAEILRNACAICGIEARYVSSKEKIIIDDDGNISEENYAYNQVKVDGKWYNVDLTLDRAGIVKGQLPQYFLKNDVDFTKIEGNGSDKDILNRYHMPCDSQSCYKCYETCPQEVTKELFKNQPKYLVSIQNLGKKIKDALKILEHKFYPTDLVDETAVLYPNGKNGQALGIEYFKSSEHLKKLSATELVTKEILEDRAKGNLSQRINTEFDSTIEKKLLETEMHLRSVELCDGILYSGSGIEESLYDGEVYVAKYWRTKNHPNPKEPTEVEEFETHKDSSDNINPKDARDREVIAYYKRDSKGNLYMFGMEDKDTTVFYDREQSFSVSSSKIKKGVQKEITTAEEIMGLEIRDKVKYPFPIVVKETGEKFINKYIPGEIQDVIKIDGAILGYSEKDAKKGKDGMIRDENTAFFLVSTIEWDGKEEYYFLDSNYEYSSVKVRNNEVFTKSKPIKGSISQDILLNVSTDKNKKKFETRKILAEFESEDLDENGNPCPKKRIAVTRDSDGKLQVIEPYGEKDGKRYACLLPQTICMDERVREKYEERHPEQYGEVKEMSSFNFESEDSRQEYKRAEEALPVAIDAYREYRIDHKDIMNQKGIILKLVSKILNKRNNKEKDNDDGR